MKNTEETMPLTQIQCGKDRVFTDLFGKNRVFTDIFGKNRVFTDLFGKNRVFTDMLETLIKIIITCQL